MVEYVYSRPKKSHKKAIIIILAVVVLAFVLLGYEQIYSVVSGIGKVTQIGCYDRMSEVCNNCFEINEFRFDIWNIPGVEFENGLVECANNNYDTKWVIGQDCTGNTIETCLLFVE